MSDFPLSGSIKEVRDWLDKEKFVGKFNNWSANQLLFLAENKDLFFEVIGRDEDGYRLWISLKMAAGTLSYLSHGQITYNTLCLTKEKPPTSSEPTKGRFVHAFKKERTDSLQAAEGEKEICKFTCILIVVIDGNIDDFYFTIAAIISPTSSKSRAAISQPGNETGTEK